MIKDGCGPHDHLAWGGRWGIEESKPPLASRYDQKRNVQTNKQKLTYVCETSRHA